MSAQISRAAMTQSPRALSVVAPANPLVLSGMLISTIAILMQPGDLKAKELTLKQTTIPTQNQQQLPHANTRLVQITTSDFKLSNLSASAFGDSDIEPELTPAKSD